MMSFNSMKIGLFTDIHLDVDYNETGPIDNHCHSSNNPLKDYAKFGRHGCDSPIPLMEAITKNLSSVLSKRDLMIYMGDSVAHCQLLYPDQPFNQTQYEIVKNTIMIVAQNAIDTFKSIILFCFGNNDYLYDYQVPDLNHKNDFYSYVYIYWIKNNPMMSQFDTRENLASFIAGGFYSIEYKDNVFLILNSQYFSVRNKNDLAVADVQLNWLENQLSNISQRQKSAILVMHMPPGTFQTPMGSETFWKDEYTQKYFAIYSKYRSLIKLTIVGHVHASIYHVDVVQTLLRYRETFINNVYVGRAISPIYENNPGFHILTLDNYNNPVSIEESTFFLDDTINKTDPIPYFKNEYSSIIDLLMKDLSGSSIQQFNIRYNTNPAFKALWDRLKFGL